MEGKRKRSERRWKKKNSDELPSCNVIIMQSKHIVIKKVNKLKT